MTLWFPDSEAFEYEGGDVYAQQDVIGTGVGHVEFRHSATSNGTVISAALTVLVAAGIISNFFIPDVQLHLHSPKFLFFGEAVGARPLTGGPWPLPRPLKQPLCLRRVITCALISGHTGEQRAKTAESLEVAFGGDADLREPMLDWVCVGATWQIRLNNLYSAAMRAVANITLATLCELDIGLHC